ncbi:hypothetical protein Dsin_015283 [Dipteronia sinensis]|uniref:Uncharacterized protein n=1 Tax=Dipteronia sinensis TaxID=43782 RepID=A0AAE0E4M0_9ROSI|nr:hypothetical protein Dsin_015283 [Dipteronia sinensis]
MLESIYLGFDFVGLFFVFPLTLTVNRIQRKSEEEQSGLEYYFGSNKPKILCNYYYYYYHHHEAMEVKIRIFFFLWEFSDEVQKSQKFGAKKKGKEKLTI